MKALLYKDFRILWKSTKAMLLLVVIFCLIPNNSFMNMGLFFVVYTGMLPLSLLAYDERSHWDRLVLMLPVTPRDVVRSKYVTGWYLTLGAGVLYLIGRLVFERMPAQEAVSSLALALAVSLLFQAVLYPVIFRMGVEKGRLTMGIMVAVTVFLCLQGKLFQIGGVNGKGLAGSEPILFAASVAAVLISIRISERMYLCRAE